MELATHPTSDVLKYPPLAAIDREVAVAHLWLTFSPDIESLYRREAVSGSRTPVFVSWLIGIVLFDLFLASDYVVASDDLMLYAIGRLGIMTPACLAVLYLASRFGQAYNGLISSMPVLVSGTLTTLLMISHGSYRADYLFGNILILICGCVINRAPLAYAICSVCLQCALFNIVLFGSDIVPAGHRLIHMLICLSGAVVALITSYMLERDSRKAFLLAMRVRLLNHDLQTIAMTDPLTGLANRRRLAEATQLFWTDRADEALMASVVLIDIDHFKLFNDHHGHMAGDDCLGVIARLLSRQLRGGRDLAVRFGGEELLVFLPDTRFDAARRVAEAICESIREARIPHPHLGEQAIVTASLGVYTVDARECTPNELIALADKALYAAKAAGRNCIWPPTGARSAQCETVARPVSACVPDYETRPGILVE